MIGMTTAKCRIDPQGRNGRDDNRRQQQGSGGGIQETTDDEEDHRLQTRNISVWLLPGQRSQDAAEGLGKSPRL